MKSFNNKNYFTRIPGRLNSSISLLRLSLAIRSLRHERNEAFSNRGWACVYCFWKLKFVKEKDMKWGKIKITVKISVFWTVFWTVFENSNYWPKFQLLTKMSIFDQTFYFWPKCRFLTKILIFAFICPHKVGRRFMMPTRFWVCYSSVKISLRHFF